MGLAYSILSSEIFTVIHKYSFYAMKKTDFGVKTLLLLVRRRMHILATKDRLR
jgi:hypothetical protein